MDQTGGERGIIYVTLNLGQKVAKITKDMGLCVKLPRITFRHQLEAQKVLHGALGERSERSSPH